MTLHCVYDAFALPLPADAEGHFAAGDAVLLLDAAVTLAATEPPLSGQVDVFALADDLDAHGITATHSRVTRIDYDGWVELAGAHPRQQVWA